MMKRVDPTIELSAALTDRWNVNLLKHCGEYLDWFLYMSIGIGYIGLTTMLIMMA